MARILVCHGPNMNLLGKREPGIYGKITLEDINRKLLRMGSETSIQVECRQTNFEGELLDWIHTLTVDDFLIINAAAWTHSSYALRDAISSVKVPAIEVHLSNIHAREEFRHHSVIAPVCIGQIAGLGAESYYLAMNYAIEYLRKAQEGM